MPRMILRLTLRVCLVGAAVLVGGWGLIRMTRYQIVGKALTLLACLVMPLNLWYYHSKGLMTVDGHLWMAAMVISGFYLASALALRDEMFVYIFCGGIVMTGAQVSFDVLRWDGSCVGPTAWARPGRASARLRA